MAALELHHAPATAAHSRRAAEISPLDPALVQLAECDKDGLRG